MRFVVLAWDYLSAYFARITCRGSEQPIPSTVPLSIHRRDEQTKATTMGYIIRAVLGESLQAALQEIERIEAATAAQGIKVTKRTPLALEVDSGGRRATESVIDNPDLNWEHSSVYMEAETPMLGNLPSQE